MSIIPLEPPSCLVAELFRCPRNPVAAWRLLRARAAELGLTECCSGVWLLLQALASAEHREASCVSLALMDGNTHFVRARRSTLESILPALAATVPSIPSLSSSAGDASGTAALAAAIEAATRPTATKIVLVEEKWPHSYGRLLLLTGVPMVAELHDFWHEYANQKKAHVGLRTVRHGFHGRKSRSQGTYNRGEDSRGPRFLGAGRGQ
jgi:hypothetical protein